MLNYASVSSFSASRVYVKQPDIDSGASFSKGVCGRPDKKDDVYDTLTQQGAPSGDSCHFMTSWAIDAKCNTTCELSLCEVQNLTKLTYQFRNSLNFSF